MMWNFKKVTKEMQFNAIYTKDLKCANKSYFWNKSIVILQSHTLS